jgi:hypothetical protein
MLCPQILTLVSNRLAAMPPAFPAQTLSVFKTALSGLNSYPEKWKPQIPIDQAARCHVPAELNLYSDTLKYHSVTMTSSYRMFSAMVTVSDVEPPDTIESLTANSDKETHYYSLTNTSRGFLR